MIFENLCFYCTFAVETAMCRLYVICDIYRDGFVINQLMTVLRAHKTIRGCLVQYIGFFLLKKNHGLNWHPISFLCCPS